MKKYSIGSDIGGSHISCAVVDLENGKLVPGSRFEGAVDNQANVDDILLSWTNVLKKSVDFISDGELVGIGFGMPGPFDYESGIARFKNVAKYESLNGVNIAIELKKRLELAENISVRFMNDASAFAVGEAWAGGAKDKNKSVAITLGTGFGSAFVENGVPVVEGQGVPKMGCVWHLPFNGDIADESFSTRWFIKRYKEECGIIANGVKPIAEASSTDTKAKGIFEEFGTNMASFLGPWLKDFEAQVLVIGGNVAKAYPLISKAFEEGLEKIGVSELSIEISKLQEDSAIIGSARMLDESYWNKVKPVIPNM